MPQCVLQCCLMTLKLMLIRRHESRRHVVCRPRIITYPEVFSTSLRPEFKKAQQYADRCGSFYGIFKKNLRCNDSEAFQWRSLRLATYFFPSLKDDMVGPFMLGKSTYFLNQIAMSSCTLYRRLYIHTGERFGVYKSN